MFGAEAEHSGILWCHPAGECCRNRARRLRQSIASEMDCLLEREGFEPSGDFVNGQRVIRKRQRVQKRLPRRGARLHESHYGCVAHSGAGLRAVQSR